MPKKSTSFSLSEEIVELVNTVENKSKLVEALLWQYFANESSKKTIIQAATMKQHLEEELMAIENDPVYVKAKNALESVTNPKFFKGYLGGGGEFVDRKDKAHFFLVGGVRTDLSEWDSYIAEKDMNAKVVKGYTEKIDAIKTELERVKSELMRMTTV